MQESQEFIELKEMIELVDRKSNVILNSLKTCQSRCHVDNPVGKWRGFGRALMALLRFG